MLDAIGSRPVYAMVGTPAMSILPSLELAKSNTAEPNAAPPLNVSESPGPDVGSPPWYVSPPVGIGLPLLKSRANVSAPAEPLTVRSGMLEASARNTSGPPGWRRTISVPTSKS